MRVAVRRRDGTTSVARLQLAAVPRETGDRCWVGTLENLAREPGVVRSEAETAAGRKTFLSWLNHELRSPLNACNMWLDVLALAPQPDRLAKAVDAIKRNLARQTRLVNVLNDAAKVQFDGIDLKRAPLDLVPLLERDRPAWHALGLAKPLTFEHRSELREARVEGDAELLSQALNHLVENSIASTPSGGRVELRARGAGPNCIVELDDGGSALSAEDVENLGTPLWRSPQSAKARAGLGLGLAVAHHIVTKHGGTLTASSGAAGARFVLALPLAADGR
jgi:signal transduction histidine kinase